MNRVTRCWVPFVLLGVAAVVGFAPPPRPQEKKAEAVIVPTPERKEPASLVARLAQRVDFKGFDDPRLTLEEALEFVSKEYKIPCDVRDSAFRQAGYADKSVLQESIAPTPVPKMSGVTVEAVVRKILGRIPTTPGKEATYLLRRGGLEITTADFAAAEVWGSSYEGPFFPLVHPDYNDRPLDQALEELSQASEHNIIVDVRAREEAKAPVTARMVNVPLDTAVRLLADMADLDAVFLDNVIMVTSRENAASWRKKLGTEQRDRVREDTGRPRIGVRFPGIMPPPRD
jgi:hypothetical protein